MIWIHLKKDPEKTSCYSKYTDLYSPNVEQEDEEPVAVNVKNSQHTAMEETDITLLDIVANLSLPIDQVVKEVLFSILQKFNKYLLLFLINLLHT